MTGELTETVAEPGAQWRERIVKVGFDLCVLAAGMGGTFYHDRGIPNGHADWEIGLVIMSLLFSVAGATVIIGIRRGTPSGIKALCALALASAAVSIPAYHVLLTTH